MTTYRERRDRSDRALPVQRERALAAASREETAMTLRTVAYTFTAPYLGLTDVRGFPTEAAAAEHAHWVNSHGGRASVVVGVHSRDELLAELDYQRGRWTIGASA